MEEESLSKKEIKALSKQIKVNKRLHDWINSHYKSLNKSLIEYKAELEKETAPTAISRLQKRVEIQERKINSLMAIIKDQLWFTHEHYYEIEIDLDGKSTPLTKELLDKVEYEELILKHGEMIDQQEMMMKEFMK